MPHPAYGMKKSSRPSILLPWAIQAGNFKRCRRLITKGKGINAQYGANQETPLHLVCNALMSKPPDWQAYRELLNLLVEHRADPNIPNSLGNTPLHRVCIVHGSRLAANEHYPKAVRTVCNALLWLGADLTLLNHTGQSPLHIAATQSNSLAVKLLLMFNANPNVRNVHREATLHLVDGLNSLAITNMLLEHGARVNLRDCDGNTPLHRVEGRQECTMLLRHGANPFMVNQQRETPLHVAASCGAQGICQELLLHVPHLPHKELVTLLMIHKFRKSSLSIISKNILRYHIFPYIWNQIYTTPITDHLKLRLAHVRSLLTIKDGDGLTPLERAERCYQINGAHTFNWRSLLDPDHVNDYKKEIEKRIKIWNIENKKPGLNKTSYFSNLGCTIA